MMRQRGLSFKEALNSATRSGLGGVTAPARAFTQETFHADVRPGVNLANALRLVADLEDEENRAQSGTRPVKLPGVNPLLHAANKATPNTRRPAAGGKHACPAAKRPPSRGSCCWLSFGIRLTTCGVAMTPALSADRALNFVDQWLGQPCATVIHPTSRHPAVLRDLLRAVGTAGNRTSDAHLAALAIEHGATLYSAVRRTPRTAASVSATTPAAGGSGGGHH